MNTDAEFAVFFVDVSESTRLYENVGDATAQAAIERCISVFKDQTKVNGGRVIKTIGDEVMAIFPSASAAADAAIEMQNAIDALPPVANFKLGVRIGFHFGPVVEREGDVFGDTVNLAARLARLASKGQIMSSHETVDRLTPTQKAVSRRLYSIEVKGKANDVDLYELLWRQGGDQTTLAEQRSAVRPRQLRLRLQYLGKELVLEGAKRSATLGRDNESDLVVIDRMASRTHGKIECRLGKFVFADHSANGTYVCLDGQPEVVLRREEIVLSGHGWIAFGQARADASAVVEFFCESD